MRRLPLIGLLSVSLVALATPALAEFKPTKPIELVVHGAPGSGPDTFGRAIVDALDKENLLPVRVQINNKTGGSGQTAMSYVVENAGDDHMLAVFTMLWLSNPLTVKEANATIHEMTPVARLVLEPALIVTKADSPYETLQDFIDAAKEKPGQLKQSGGSITARDNIMRQILMAETDTDWVFISFPGGGERLAALLGGHVDLLMMEPQEVGEQVRAGSVRVLAQVNDKRLPEYADVPTLKEAGFDVPNVPQGRGLVAPPTMSEDAVAYYVDVLRRMSETPTWKAFLDRNQMDQAFAGPEDTKAFFDSFVADMRVVLTAAGVEIIR